VPGIVSTKDLGGVEVSMVNSGRLVWTPSFDLDSRLDGNAVERDSEGHVILGHNVMCIRTARDVVLVDPTAWLEDEDYGELAVIDRHPIEEALEALGIRAEDVTHLVISHAHADHVTGLIEKVGDTEVPRFRNAVLHFPAQDWNRFVELDEAGRRENLLRYAGPIEKAGKLRLVDGDAEICDGVSVVHTAGESPGHQAVRATGSNGTIYYLGDQFHWAFEFPRPDWTPMAGKIPEELAVGRRKILTQAIEEDATLVFTHAPFPGWGGVDGAWNWHYETDSVSATA
jgi:glyoxylase-like metal-dependent hydrolase (beta-lactamase superfamily II)